jgi:hypothetical protein
VAVAGAFLILVLLVSCLAAMFCDLDSAIDEAILDELWDDE